MFTGQQFKAKRLSLKWSVQRTAKYFKTKPGNIYKWEEGVTPKDPELFHTIDMWVGNKTNGVVKPHEDISDYREKYFSLLEKYTLLLEKIKH